MTGDIADYDDTEYCVDNSLRHEPSGIAQDFFWTGNIDHRCVFEGNRFGAGKQCFCVFCRGVARDARSYQRAQNSSILVALIKHCQIHRKSKKLYLADKTMKTGVGGRKAEARSVAGNSLA